MEATAFEHPDDPEAVIHYLGDYHPWGWHKLLGGDSSNWDNHSSSILDLKKSKEYALKRFADHIVKTSELKYAAVTAVPSHDPACGIDTGVRLLAARVAKGLGVTDGRNLLRRSKLIVKLAGGGSRDVSVHMASIVVDGAGTFYRGRVLLLDDVMTSGNSLIACRRILMNAGAAEVICLALGKTKH